MYAYFMGKGEVATVAIVPVSACYRFFFAIQAMNREVLEFEGEGVLLHARTKDCRSSSVCILHLQHYACES